MEIYCCNCKKDIEARLTNGAEVYPHRPDLSNLPFWIHDECGNWVGCHHKTKNRTRPLGHIPHPAMKRMRMHIHQIIDPIWRNGYMTRREVYAAMSELLGWNFHTSKLRDVDECEKALKAAKSLI